MAPVPRYYTSVTMRDAEMGQQPAVKEAEVAGPCGHMGRPRLHRSGNLLEHKAG